MTLIIDPQNSGIAGNMLLGAFIDLGVDVKELKELIDYVSSPFSQVELDIKKVNTYGIEAIYVDVLENGEKADSNNSHNKTNIRYTELLNKIDSLKTNELLSNEIIEKSKSVFERIAISESKIHGKPLDKIHFHEVGAVDGIVDVFGAIFSYFALELT
ncbi:MAG: DUF111 family protein, partial [Methanobrevibacter sp.]|nr:DUF111 family protein [Methanobrevibacter sp.]